MASSKQFGQQQRRDNVSLFSAQLVLRLQTRVQVVCNDDDNKLHTLLTSSVPLLVHALSPQGNRLEVVKRFLCD